MAGHSLKKSLRHILSQNLSSEEVVQVYNSYDVVGDIAIIRSTWASGKYRRKIAEAIMGVHRNVKTVLAQTSPVHGGFRIRRLEHVAGENKTFTTHVESGCVFSVDVSKCYFSPRLSYEHMRVAKQVKNGEVVVNMFAGVGCFSVLIAKHSNASRVYSIDVNPVAFQSMRNNIRVNRVFGKVIPILGDAAGVIEARLRRVADRVLMPLPEKALEYLPWALSALKAGGGHVHYYDFEHAKKGEDVVEKVRLGVSEKLASLHVAYDVPFGRLVRSTGPNWYQVVLDVVIRGQSGKFNK
jgi:tRNA (guanine37-N1)-methyltransferase